MTTPQSTETATREGGTARRRVDVDAEDIDPKRLVALHLDTALQTLLEAPDTDRHRALRNTLSQLENMAYKASVELPVDRLRERFGLGPLETNLLLLGTVHQLRPDMSGRGLTVAEALSMQLTDPVSRLEALAALRPSSPLRRHRLLDLHQADRTVAASDLMRRELTAPLRVQAYLLGQRALSEELSETASFAPERRYLGHAREGLPAEEMLAGYITRWKQRDGQRALSFTISGASGAGKTTLVRSLAERFEVPLLEIDASHLASLRTGIAARRLDDLLAAVELYGSWLAIDRVDALDPASPLTQRLARQLDQFEGRGTVSFLVSPRRLPASHTLSPHVLRHVDVTVPDEDIRRAMWTRHFDAETLTPPSDEDLNLLAGKFELSPAQIRNAVRETALGRADLRQRPTFEQIESMAFDQMRGDLSELATVRRGNASMDDLVLPEAEMRMIDEIIRAARYRTELLHGWRFKRRFAYGTGVVCLFSGDPGTGKTFAAETIADELNLELYQIAVPQVVSKWVGETEKQISRIFTEARAARALLLFDEADSLFGSRTEVRTASDRYANMATNYLLQAIEAHEGVVILTTNLEENLDAAAERRILFRLRFPFPDAETRAILWRKLLPNGAPVADDVEFEELGELFELSGGHIKNAIIRAAYDALHHSRALDQDTLIAAAEREARMSGRLVRGWS